MASVCYLQDSARLSSQMSALLYLPLATYKKSSDFSECKPSLGVVGLRVRCPSASLKCRLSVVAHTFLMTNSVALPFSSSFLNLCRLSEASVSIFCSFLIGSKRGQCMAVISCTAVILHGGNSSATLLPSI